MESLYLWPDNPALSLLALWLVSAVFLWAAREPVFQVLSALGRSVEGGLTSMSEWCATTARNLHGRSREQLLAAGELELQSKMSRELHRIDASFSEKLGQYSTLHRKLDDLIHRIDADYAQCGDSPPQVPGWAGAVEAVSNMPDPADPNIKKVLQGIRASMSDAEKKALKSYREDTARRHKILSRMRPHWKEISTLASRIADAVAKARQSSSKIERQVDEYAKILKDRESAAHAMTYSAVKPFVISLIVLAIALGGAFINFQLIALPMSELVPAGARLGGIPVSTVSALVIVLMEAAVGIFVMDMLGITDLFPKLSSVAPSRRRMILFLSLGGLFFLAAVESSLAILREQIVEADAALKMSLAGAASNVVAQPTTSSIPVVGQAVLGFILPWILAMMAIPLEMLIDSGRHIASGVTVLALQGLGNGVRVLAHAAHSLTSAVPAVYDVYIALPLKLERMVRRDAPRDERPGRRRPPLTTGERRMTNPGVA